MQSEEGRAGACDEDAELVEERVEGVEGAVGCEGCGGQGEEERWGYALVYGVFGDVDEEEGEHVGEEEEAGAVEVCCEG